MAAMFTVLLTLCIAAVQAMPAQHALQPANNATDGGVSGLAAEEGTILDYAFVQPNENTAQLAERLHMSLEELRAVNEWPLDFEPAAGLRVNALVQKPAIQTLQGGGEVKVKDERKVRQFMEDLVRPGYNCENKVRIGDAEDGGYIICNDFPIQALVDKMDGSGGKCLVYTFGIDGNWNFENELIEKNGCEVHGYDPTVDHRESYKFQFHKTGLLDKEQDVQGVGHVKPFSQLKAENGQQDRALPIVKCDIEGSEWPALEQMEGEQMDKIGHFLLELHIHGDTSEVELDKFLKVTKKLKEHFFVYHSHINNNGGVRMWNGILMPNVWEVSFVSKKTVELFGKSGTASPQAFTTNKHSLDQRTRMNKPEVECTCSETVLDCHCAQIQDKK